MNPVNWWHQEEGGKIAQDRPPPPGSDQPYPNLASVPSKPEAPNKEDLDKLTAALVADRTNAQHTAQAQPLPDPSSPSASPALFGVGSTPPPPPPGASATATPPAAGQSSGGQSIASASIPAASAPPPAPDAPVPAPAPAPRRAVEAAPLAAPTPTAPTASTAPTPSASTAAPPASASAPSAPTPAAPETTAMAQPALPSGPPPRPAAAGAPPPEPTPPSVMPAAVGKNADIVFPESTATLSTAAGDEVKSFAAQRGNAVIGVTGYGDATGSDARAQTAGLNLGLARAQSIVEALKAAGVPGNAIRVGAEASGRGASLRLLQ